MSFLYSATELISVPPGWNFLIHFSIFFRGVGVGWGVLESVPVDFFVDLTQTGVVLEEGTSIGKMIQPHQTGLWASPC